jgi:hypothetical protein
MLCGMFPLLYIIIIIIIIIIKKVSHISQPGTDLRRYPV